MRFIHTALALSLMVASSVAAAIGDPGTLDDTFGDFGAAQLPQACRGIKDLAQINGGGVFVLCVGQDTNILKLTATGQIDQAFGEFGMTPAIPGNTLGDGQAKVIEHGEYLYSIDSVVLDQELIVPRVCRFTTGGALTGWEPKTNSPCVILGTNNISEPARDAEIDASGITILSRNGKLIRLTLAGEPDTQFSADGIYTLPVPEGASEPATMDLHSRPGGGWFVAGWTNVLHEGESVARGYLVSIEITDNGTPSLDPDFAGGQPVIHNCASADFSSCYYVKQETQGDKLITLADGVHDEEGLPRNRNMVIERNLSTGELLASVKLAGPYGVDRHDLPIDITPSSTGELYVASGWKGTTSHAALARAIPGCAYALDEVRFAAPYGQLLMNFIPDAPSVGTRVIEADGRLLIGGTYDSNPPNGDYRGGLFGLNVEQPMEDRVFANRFECGY